MKLNIRNYLLISVYGVGIAAILASGGIPTRPAPTPGDDNGGTDETISCSQPRCIAERDVSGAGRQSRLFNDCAEDWEVAFCVTNDDGGAPECSSPNQTIVRAGMNSGIIVKRSVEAATRWCACEKPDLTLELSNTTPWDGSGSCIKNE